MGLVTLTDVKAFTKVIGTADDDFIQLQIDIASDAVEEFCRRKFAPQVWQETFLWCDRLSSSITLYQYPVIEIVSVSGVTDPLDYLVHKPTGKLRPRYQSTFWPTHNESITVTYKAGFDPLPAPLKYAILSIVAGNYNKKKSGVDLSFGSDVQRMSIPGTISIDFDYSLQNNEPQTKFGLILGSLVNIINPYVSDRAIMGNDKLAYIEAVP